MTETVALPAPRRRKRLADIEVPPLEGVKIAASGMYTGLDIALLAVICLSLWTLVALVVFGVL